MRFFVGGLLFLASSALAATTEVKILVDADKNVSTGCRVFTAAGNFDGVEQIFTTTFDSTAMTVNGVVRQQCTDPAIATFGSPITVDSTGWAVGTSGGNLVVETHIPTSTIGGAHSVRLGFTASSGTLADAMLQQIGGGAIIFTPDFAIPGRHHAVWPAAGRTITRDGNISDWDGIGSLVGGSSISSSPSLRFNEIRAAESADELSFLFLIQANPSAPTANPETFSVLRGGTLNITPPGILANDTDPHGLPLTAVLISGAEHGTLTVNPNGSFTYTNDGSPAPVDSFRYKASNGTQLSNAANDTINVLTGTPPSITSGSTATFTVGVSSSFTVTATGNPTPTLSRSGALPTGVSFNTGTGVLSGTPAVGTGGSYPITFTSTNAAGTANQNFTLNVNEGPIFTSANATTMVVGTAASFTVTASGFPAPSIVEAGALPAGVNYNSSTHVLSGIPTAPGVFNLTFTATNLLGIATQNFTLTVNQLPAITSANNTTFTVGIAGSFTVTATGFPTPTLGESGALPAVVTFNAGSGVLSGTPAAGTGGVYSITFSATNAAGTATQTFTLTVNQAPAITTAAVNQTVCAGATATFTAAASGFPAPTVQWQVSSGGPFADIPGATSTTLSFATVAADNGKQYRAVFTNAGGTAQTTATLTVNTPPVVTTNPVAQAVCAGTNATFAAAASGTPAPTVQWQVSSGGPFADILGATSTTLTFTTVAADNGKQYRAVFTNACGTANTTAATLTVNTAPVVTTNPAPITICNNTTATFTAAASGIPTPTVQWEVSSGGPFAPIPGATNTTLSFNATTADNTKQYHAVFTNACGTATSAAATLTVTTVPVVTTNPLTQTICAGATVTFTAATSSPATSLQWQVSTGGPFTDIPGATSTTLSFPTVAADNGKQYQAVFTNVCGTATSTAATLTVNVAPAVTTQPVAQILCVGATATFTAAASGTPAPSVQWQVSSGGPFADIPGATSTTLSFSTVAGDNGKQYRAVFTNSCATATTNAVVLTVDTLPVVTTNPLTQTICAGATVNFTAAATSNASDHTVQWQVSTGGPFADILGATSTTLSFTAAAGDNGKQYRAVFTDSCGSVNTSAATLTVDTLPVVTTNPLTQTLCVGATATFTAAATSNASDHTVQWQVSSGGPFSDLPGATSTTLSFATVAADNGKQYRAVFTNACGVANSSAAVLTVDTLPVVSVNPLTQTTCAGTLVTFTAAATSNASDHTVQWQVDTGSGFNNIPGATSTTLSFTPVAGQNGNQFRAVFTDSCGSTNSAAAALTVDTLPVVTLDPASQTLCAGASANFTAAATSNASDHTVQWQVDGGSGFANIPGATTTTLNFAAAAADNGKQYRAVFTDACGSTNSAAATLTVNSPPAITQQPANASFCENTSATFTAAASGPPAPTVQWQVSSGGPFTDIPGATSATLTFTATLADNGHQYQAVFTNVCGTATSAPATLTVEQAISITTQPTDQSVTANTPVTFTSAATNFASVQWRVSTDGGTIFNPVPGATNPSLTFSPPLSANGNKYKATYTNSCGSVDTNVVTLTVTCPAITVARTGGGSFPAGTFNTAYNGQSVTASGGAGPYTFAVTSGALPGNLSLASNGTISGTPSTTGTFNFTVTATDASLCTGVQSFSIAINPVPNPDAYSNLVNNTQAVVTGGGTASPSTPFVTLTGTITSNDLPGGGVALTTGTFSTAQSGSVTIAVDGTFVYTPPVTASALATDSFTYTIGSDTGGTGTPTTANGTVTLNLAGRVWYVKNNAAGGGNGQSQSPFNSTSNFTNGARVSPDKPSDIIFVYFGDATTNNQNGGVAMLDNEQLIGEGVALVVNTFTLVPAGANPLIGNTTAAAVTLANGNTLKGFTATTTVGATLAGISGNALTTGPVIDLVIVGPTTGAGLNLTASGTITTSLTNVAISGAGTVGINANTFGTLTVNAGVNVAGTSALSLNTGAVNTTTPFANVSSTGGLNGVSLTAITGTLNASGGTLTGASGATFLVTNGTFSSTWQGNITQTSLAPLVSVTGHTTGTITFDTGTLSSTGGTGLQFSGATGTYNFNGPTTLNGGTAGVNIAAASTGTFNFGTGVVIGNTSSPSGAAFTVNGSTPAVTYSGDITKSSAGFLVDITNQAASARVITFQTGTLTGSGTSTGINLNNVDGTVNFNGTTTLSGTAAVSVNTGSSGTISFSAGTTMTNVSGTSFTVTGSNPILTDAGTITTNTGTLVSVNALSGNSVTFSGNLTSTAAATAILLTNNTGGTITFSGASKSFSTSTADAIVMTTNTGSTTNFTGGGLSITTTTGQGVNASGGGTLTFTGGANDISSGNTALLLNGIALGVSSLNNVNTTGGTSGISLTNVTGGTLTIAGGTLSGATGTTFLVSGGSVSVTDGGAISQATAGQLVISISGGHSGTINFNGNVQTSGSSTGINISGSSGTYNFNGATNTIAGSGGGITIGSGESGTVNFGSGTAITSGGTSFQVNGNPTAVTAAITFSGTINKTSAGQMISVDNLDSPGTLNMTHAPAASGNLTQSTAGSGISVINSSSTNITISNATVNFTSTAEGFTASGNTGATINLNGLILVGNGTKAGVLISGGGTINVSAGAANPSINVSGGSGRAIDGTTTAFTGALNLNNATINGNGTADIVTLTSSSLGGGGSTISGAQRALVLSGVALANGGGMTSVTSSGGANGISLTNVTGGTYTISGGSLSGNSGSAFLVSGGTATLTYGGSITQNTAGQRAVNISGITGGTITLSGAIGSNGGTGVSVAGTGGTVTITGGMTLNGTNSVFSATGSGMTVNVTGTNTVGSTTAVTSGTAVDITCTIGASNVTFRKVSSTGVGTGIILSNTGSGTFTITGSGAVNCKTIAANCDGGTIQTSTGPGMNFTSTAAISLTNVNVTGGGDDGIRGNAVGGFTLVTSQVTNNGNAVTERGIEMTNLTGTGAITNSTITGNAEDNLWIQNSTGTLSSFNVTGSTFSNTSTSIGNDGIHFEGIAGSSPQMTISVTGCTFNHNRGDHFQVVTDAVATGVVMNATFNNNTLTGDRGTTYGGTDLGACITINTGGAANVTYDVENNNITGSVSSAISINSSNTSVLHGTLNANTIGTIATIDSGSSQGDGFSIFANGSSAIRALITNNIIRQYSNLAGINIQQRSGSATVQAVVTGNTISNGGTFAAEGIFVSSGTASGDSGTMCLNIGGAGALANSFAGAGANGSSDFRVRQRFLTTVRLPGYGGANTDTAAVVAFIQGRNNGSPSGQATVPAPFTGGGFIGGAACTAP